MKDPYREWSYADRVDAGKDHGNREDCRRYDRDSESSERAYDNWRSGGDFSDPDQDGRFH
jgi:hypothetical protein